MVPTRAAVSLTLPHVMQIPHVLPQSPVIAMLSMTVVVTVHCVPHNRNVRMTVEVACVLGYISLHVAVTIPLVADRLLTTALAITLHTHV